MVLEPATPTTPTPPLQPAALQQQQRQRQPSPLQPEQRLSASTFFPLQAQQRQAPPDHIAAPHLTPAHSAKIPPYVHMQLSSLSNGAPPNSVTAVRHRLAGMPPEGLHPTAALQLYAAAAQLAPAGVRVPHWSPFLQFGVPGMFAGTPFLGRPRFEASGPPAAAAAAAAAATASQMAVSASDAFANLTGLMRNVSAAQTTAVAAVATAAIQQRLMIGNRPNLPSTGPPSEGSNEDAGNLSSID